MSIPVLLHIPRRLYEEMLAHANAEFPLECCGLLAGSAATGEVTAVYPLANEAVSPVRYSAEAKSMLHAFRAMRERGTGHLAIYHSHPVSDSVPSRTDLANNFYGSEMVHLIISLKGADPLMRGWQLGESDFREVGWELVED